MDRIRGSRVTYSNRALSSFLLASLVVSALWANRPLAHAQDRAARADRALQFLEERGIRANPYRPGRTMAMSRHGMVAAEHQLVALAGLDMLRGGGSAMDAAIAAAAAVAVIQPMMTGPGGDAWLLYYEAATGKVHALNGSGHSPAALSRDYFRENNKSRINGRSWEAVTVPGAVDAWVTAHERFGKKPLAEVLAPAIRYAEEGYPITEVVQMAWTAYSRPLGDDKWARQTYLVDGKPPSLGSVFKNPNLARSLRLIADGGRDAFYRGPIAEEIVRYAQETGGFLTMADFAAHHSDWVEPISTDYRGYEVFQCPPNGQGIGVLMMLNILEGYDLASMKFNSPEYLHLLIEAKKLAYADLYKYIADPTKSDVPIAELLSKSYAAKRRERIDLARAAPQVDPGIPLGSDTTYLTAIDSEGNAVSFINSLYAAFGSGIVGGSTGIVLQNRGSGFTLQEGHANEYAAGKRPYHTIIPGMVLRDGKLYLSYGLMGGPMQPQGHVQFLLAHLDHGLSIQEAIDVPRWRHTSGAQVLLEHGAPRATIRALRIMGHEVLPADGANFGASQAILVDPRTGTYFGGSDPRRDGAALGW